jgi:hypothetical protein
MKMMRVVVTKPIPYLLCVLWLTGVGASFTVPEQPSPQSLFMLFGRVELVPGVPCNRCSIVVSGTPVNDKTEQGTGLFQSRVPAGTWRLRIMIDEIPGLPPFERFIASTPGVTVDLGVVVVSAPGSVSGHLNLASADQIATGVVGIAEQGLFTRPDAAGNFLLQGVAPGQRTLVFLQPNQPPVARTVTVAPRQATMNANFDFLKLQPGVQSPNMGPGMMK